MSAGGGVARSNAQGGAEGAPADALDRRVLALLAARAKGATLDMDSAILADAALDSVSVMDFLLEVEDALDVTVPLERLAGVKTVRDFTAVVRTLQEASA